SIWEHPDSAPVKATQKNCDGAHRHHTIIVDLDGELEPEATDLQPQDRPTYDPICLNCNVTKKEIPSDHFQLYLHCLKYSTEKWSYSTPLPEWAIQPEPS
ncbi:hypothetical protein COOONC_26054, partial [Cooperia oncophora]